MTDSLTSLVPALAADAPRAQKPEIRSFDAAEFLNHDAVIEAYLWHARASGVPALVERAEAAVERARARRQQAAA